MKKYLTTILLAFTLPLGEIHTFWERNTTVQNWIIARNVPMLIHWNVKLFTDQLLFIIIFVAAYFYDRNRINKATIQTFICFSILDSILYFYNYKTYGYGYVYILLPFIWITFYKWEQCNNLHRFGK